MTCKRNKDTSGLIAKWRLNSKQRHYYDVFLWKDQSCFDQNTNDNEANIAAACVNFMPTKLLISESGEIKKITKPKKLGEIHFLKDKWNMEIVAHELCHALLMRIRGVPKPKICDLLRQVGTSE